MNHTVALGGMFLLYHPPFMEVKMFIFLCKLLIQLYGRFQGVSVPDFPH